MSTSYEVRVGPFVLLYVPESRSRYWAEPAPAHWRVDGNVSVAGSTPEECVLQLRSHLLDTFLSLTVTTPETLDRSEQLIAQVGALESWLLSR
jgi:hypothetical protein